MCEILNLLQGEKMLPVYNYMYIMSGLVNVKVSPIFFNYEFSDIEISTD